MTLLKTPQGKLRELASTVTQARVGLNRAGASLSTKEILKFNLDHALARDAIYTKWNVSKLQNQCHLEGFNTLLLKSKICNREDYLLNPPDGCKLNHESQESLKTYQGSNGLIDICVIVSDGLSSAAIEDHAFNFIKILFSKFKNTNFILSSLMLVPFGRVAISDQIGMLLKAKVAIILIGERPGLSAHNSMGIYITHNPKIGCSNADRSCISNIRPPYGLSYEHAWQEVFNQIAQDRLLSYDTSFLKK